MIWANSSARSSRWVSGRVSRKTLGIGVLVALLSLASLLVLVTGWSQSRYLVTGLDLDASPKVEVKAPPRGVWISVDADGGRLRVYRGAELLREASCSTGSGVRLRDEIGDREWVFHTPIGLRRVERKVRDPVWAKPDWAFLEEGQEPPAPGSQERFDDVSLGDYALYLGDGYLIHGTLFQTLIGQPVTHGCIRLGDADLEYVYRTVPVGAPVYLY